jgi:S-adenosylmethionine decarboxylase proenzyme
MNGLQLCADLHGCAPALPPMTELVALRQLCIAAVESAGLSAVADRFHAFEPAAPGQPAGVTGVVLLAESHLAVHTWPEQGAVTIDCYVCNLGGDNSAKARALLDHLQSAFAPQRSDIQEIPRGRLV